MKQALVEGAVRLPEPPMYEQGAGRINLPRSQAVLAAYSPRASLIPPAIDLTDCPYFWPYCTQPLYAFGLPVGLNATVVNGMGVTGRLAGAPTYTPSGAAGGLLHVSFAHSEVLWPWSGFLAVYVEVRVCVRA
jgi:membrane-bound transcription factor site-1 protease